MDEPQPTLSLSLAALDLSGVDADILAALIAKEATLVLGGGDAAVWRHDDAHQAFVLDQRGREKKAVHAAEDERWLVLASPSLVRPGEAGGLIDSLAIHSVSASRSGYLLAIPLISTARTVGLLLVSFDQEPESHLILRLAVPFAAQAGGLLRNHEVLQTSREQAAAVDELSQAARELFLTLNPAALCETAVRHACALASAPIAYLLAIDPGSGTISVRSSTGLGATNFLDLEPSSLELLVGPELQSGNVESTVDYLTDHRICHRPEVDEAVRAEGIRSLMAAPLRSGQLRIGTLYVADRRIRDFALGLPDALAHLAKDTALALGNAALYEETTVTLRALTESSETLRAENERLRKAAHEPSHRVSEGAVIPAEEKPVEVPPLPVLPPEPAAPAVASPSQDVFADLLTESLSSLETSRPLATPYRLLVLAADEQTAAAPRSRQPAPLSVRVQLAEVLQAQPWCRRAADQEGNVVALIDADLADPSSTIASVLDAHQSAGVSVRGALGPPCTALDQYRASHATCRRTLSFLSKVGGPRVVEVWKTGALLPRRMA